VGIIVRNVKLAINCGGVELQQGARCVMEKEAGDCYC
jgi:hypothetical protein